MGDSVKKEYTCRESERDKDMHNCRNLQCFGKISMYVF